MEKIEFSPRIVVNRIKNPRWADAAHTAIDCDVDFEHLDEVYVPFTANPQDIEPHGLGIYNVILASGMEIAEYVAPPVTKDDLIRNARQQAMRQLLDERTKETIAKIEREELTSHDEVTREFAKK